MRKRLNQTKELKINQDSKTFHAVGEPDINLLLPIKYFS